MHIVNISLHEVFQAFSDPYRIRIVRLMLLIKGEICLCEISEALNEPEYKLSRHLKILKSTGLIGSVRDGKWIYHSLVRNQKYLKFIYKAIELFPGSEQQLKNDFLRFQKKSTSREKGRCRLPSRVAESSTEKKAKA